MESSFLTSVTVPYLCPEKKGEEKEKVASALGSKMDAQTNVENEHKQTKQAAT